jgi:hypothetical protein
MLAAIVVANCIAHIDIVSPRPNSNTVVIVAEQDNGAQHKLVVDMKDIESPKVEVWLEKVKADFCR